MEGCRQWLHSAAWIAVRWIACAGVLRHYATGRAHRRRTGGGVFRVAVDRNEAHRSASVDAFYPLTMPLTVGPGSISVAIALGAQRPQEATGFFSVALLAAAASAGLAAIALTIYFCYRFASQMVALLGANGINVMIRLSAFILLCI